MWWPRLPWLSWEGFLRRHILKIIINSYLCSTGSFSNMSGGLVSWPKESTNRIILENWPFYVVNVFMKALQIHKSQKMLFIVHKCFLPNYVQNHKYSSTRTRCSSSMIIMFHHSYNVCFRKMFTSCWQEGRYVTDCECYLVKARAYSCSSLCSSAMFMTQCGALSLNSKLATDFWMPGLVRSRNSSAEKFFRSIS